jgi:deoxyribodipyrimidine photo-lyase
MQISERVRLLNERSANNNAKYILYWMQMFKRTSHNHALNFAIEEANKRKLPLLVYEGLKYYYPWANDRIHSFILEGVPGKKEAFAKRGISYIFCLQQDKGSPKDTVARLAKNAALIVTDDFPCFIIPEHNRRVAQKAEIPVYAVDSNGIVPMSRFEKEEYAAYTIRPKIKRMLPEYLVPFQEKELIVKDTSIQADCPGTTVTKDNIAELVSKCEIDHSVKPSPVYHGGEEAGRSRLSYFADNLLSNYEITRNKPDLDGSSRLSAYLHFGFLSVNQIVEEVYKHKETPKASRDAYLEELIVRRELSYNFTRFNPNYDSLECLPNWTKETMRAHADDKRELTYSLKELEAAQTHDPLWNAAQKEMLYTGGMHNYIRMLWGKNVIGWSRTYEEAFAALEHLNNKYCLDGRNPNSYAGIMWCFGKHDRPWFERPVFGTIRYMASHSTGKKFDSKKYIAWVDSMKKGE